LHGFTPSVLIKQGAEGYLKQKNHPPFSFVLLRLVPFTPKMKGKRFKFEARSTKLRGSKQIRITEIQMTKTKK
jgi:hypothetical protein